MTKHSKEVDDILEFLRTHESNVFRGMRGSTMENVLRQALTEAEQRGREEATRLDWQREAEIRQEERERVVELAERMKEYGAKHKDLILQERAYNKAINDLITQLQDKE